MTQHALAEQSPQRIYAQRCHLRDLWKESRTLWGHATLAALTDEIRDESDPRIEEDESRYRGPLPIGYGTAPAWPFARRPMTLEGVGHVFQLTRERVRQIEARAFQKLRENKLLRELHAGARLRPGWTPAHEAALQRAPRMAFVRGELERLRRVMRTRGPALGDVRQAEVTRQIHSLFQEWMNQGGHDGR